MPMQTFEAQLESMKPSKLERIRTNAIDSLIALPIFWGGWKVMDKLWELALSWMS